MELSSEIMNLIGGQFPLDRLGLVWEKALSTTGVPLCSRHVWRDVPTRGPSSLASVGPTGAA